MYTVIRFKRAHVLFTNTFESLATVDRVNNVGVYVQIVC